MKFETLGWFLEYYSGGKFIGTKKLDEPDREKIGYYSRKDSTAEENIKLDNGKIIKQGSNYYTRMYPLNGKRIS